MNKSIAEKAQRYFTTGVGLITSYGPHGQDVRINFILFERRLRSGAKNHTWKHTKSDSLLHVLIN